MGFEVGARDQEKGFPDGNFADTPQADLSEMCRHFPDIAAVREGLVSVVTSSTSNLRLTGVRSGARAPRLTAGRSSSCPDQLPASADYAAPVSALGRVSPAQANRASRQTAQPVRVRSARLRGLSPGQADPCRGACRIQTTSFINV